MSCPDYFLSDSEIEDLQGSPEDDFDLDDCDLADLIDSLQPRCYDGDPESGPREPVFWIDPVDRVDCDVCGAKNQRVLKTSTAFAGFDPTVVSHLACGHVAL